MADVDDAGAFRKAYLALGSNLGDRRTLIDQALAALDKTPGIRVLRIAPVIETEPVGPSGQGLYLNTACVVETTFSADELLACCLRIEKDLGRDRTQEVRWGARPIDLDILMMDGVTCQTPTLEIPHPRMHERRFVLEPLAQIAPDVEHPRLGKTVRELLDILL